MWAELRETPEVLWGFGLALVLVLLLTPAAGGMARLIGAVDTPERRRIHRLPIPRLGGLALFLGILVPSLAFLPIEQEMRGLLLGAAVATMVGALDDARGLLWWQKLGGMLVAAVIPVAFGIWVDRFTFPFVGIHELPAWIGMPATVLWIVLLMNMVNFLDGMDGLAAGVCAISGTTFAVIALSLGKPDAAVVAAIVAGACFGFLRHNFYPARIFMGDSGALLLGFVLATVAVQGLLKTAATVALFFPLFVLAVPILDTTFVVLRRLKHGQPIYTPDQAHLHHRFLRRGYSQRRATLTMYAWCITLAAAALATRFIPFREGGEWHLWPTLFAGAIGLVAVGFSLFVVYQLEIVKLANPYVAQAERAAEEGQSSALGARQEPLEHLVEARRPLRRVAGARDDRALRRELPLQHVAHRVEDRRVRAADDEDREAGPSQRRERDACLVRQALDEQQLRAALQRRRQLLRHRHRRADAAQELLEEEPRARASRRTTAPRSGRPSRRPPGRRGRRRAPAARSPSASAPRRDAAPRRAARSRRRTSGRRGARRRRAARPRAGRPPRSRRGRPARAARSPAA